MVINLFYYSFYLLFIHFSSLCLLSICFHLSTHSFICFTKKNKKQDLIHAHPLKNFPLIHYHPLAFCLNLLSVTSGQYITLVNGQYFMYFTRSIEIPQYCIYYLNFQMTVACLFIAQ